MIAFVTADTIEDVNKRTTVAEFKKNLIYDERIDVKVLSGEDEMADDAIVSDFASLEGVLV